MKVSLPEWMESVPGTQTFIIDPDIFYPEYLKELGNVPVNRYWLEVALGCMKFDFDLIVRLNSMVNPRLCTTRLIRSDDGRKERWALIRHPNGHMDWATMGVVERSQEIRKHYRRIRGQTVV